MAMIGKRKRGRDIGKPMASMVADTFVKTLQADDDTICVFCKRGKSEGKALFEKFPNLHEMCDLDDSESIESRLQSGIDSTGIWACVYPIGMSKTRYDKMVWSHFVCAVFSPRAWLSSSIWHNIKSEISRSSYFDCFVCKQKGASVGCVLGKCNYVVHVHCAIELLGWRPTIMRREFLCPQHQARAGELEQLADEEFGDDISRGQESMPVTMERADADATSPPSTQTSVTEAEVVVCKECTVGKQSVLDGSDERTKQNRGRDFIYLNRSIDSDATQSVVRNTNKLPCCDCEGMCNDPDTCACLRRSLALQYRKDLMVTEGSAVEESDGDESTMTSGSRTSVAVLAECGMRCSCSVRRCKNRAVSKGVQWRLHVFIPRELVPSTAGLSNGEVSLVYGVKTRENIAIGNFVCEMTGQYIFEGCAEELKARLAESTRGTEGKAEGDDDCKAMMLSPLDNRRVISVWRWAEDCYRPEGEEACRMSALHWNECQLSANRDDTDSASSGSLATASAANGGESAHGNLYLDCRLYGNVGRFIRCVEDLPKGLDCRANLCRKIVYIDQAEPMYPRLVLYAARDILADEELFV